MATQTVTFRRLEQWLAGLNGQAAQIDFSRPLADCRLLVIKDIRDNFQGSHGPDGTPWKPLRFGRARTPSATSQAFQGPGSAKPLLDRGLLQASLTGRGKQGSVDQLTARSLEYGTNLDYAETQQEGRTISGKVMAIPLTREAYNHSQTSGGRARGFPEPLHLVWPKGRATGWLVQDVPGKRGGKGAKSIFHYLLTTRVVIPPRPFLGFNDKLTDRCEDVLVSYLQQWCLNNPIA